MNIFGNKKYKNITRTLNPELESELLDMLPPGSKVRITSLLGNAEAYGFATEIKEYLSERGYKADGVYQAVYTNPVDGQIVEPPDNENKPWNIIIGNRN